MCVLVFPGGLCFGLVVLLWAVKMFRVFAVHDSFGLGAVRLCSLGSPSFFASWSSVQHRSKCVMSGWSPAHPVLTGEALAKPC